jgi:hypothetical protein
MLRGFQKKKNIKEEVAGDGVFRDIKGVAGM